jgi:hypothetical protein
MFSFSLLRNIKKQVHTTFEMHRVIKRIEFIGFIGFQDSEKKTIRVSIYGKEI